MISKRGLAIAVAASFIVGSSLGLISGVFLARIVFLSGWRGGAAMHWGRPEVPGHLMPGRGMRGRPIPPPGMRGRGMLGPEMRGAGPGPMFLLLARELDLSETQRGRIEQILDRSRGAWAAVRDSTRAAIERELTPEQRAKWIVMEQRFPGVGLWGLPHGPGRGRPSRAAPEPKKGDPR
jgi:hypothetical protein